MTKELKLFGSDAFILLDEEDYQWVKQWDWQRVTFQRKHDEEPRVFIKRKNNRIYLHHYMFPSSRSLLFKFADKNPLNYTRSNIILTTYYKEYTYKEKDTSKDLLKPGGIYVGVLENRCIIRSSEHVGREDICITCSELEYYDWYRNCLNVGAYENWRGWHCVKCSRFDSIKKMKEENKLILL